MRLAILGPTPGYDLYADVWPHTYERYRRVLVEAGIEVEQSPWTEPLAPGFDAALGLGAWGYHLEPRRWLEVLSGWSGPPLLNPPAVMAWNTRKTYLAELAAAGAPVTPTLAFDGELTPRDLQRARERFGVDTLVAKPAVAASGYGACRLEPGEVPPTGLGETLVQPFMDSVSGEGELSLFHFGGRFSHAVRKVAAEGDFRVQAEYGGAQPPTEAPAEALRAAAEVLAVAPSPLTYARVDMVRGPDGRFVLMELELIEPELYLGMAPDGGRLFADAVRQTIAA